MNVAPDECSDIKFWLMQQFYGIEEIMDMPEPLPHQISHLDATDSQFNLIRSLLTLDLWFIKVQDKESGAVWNPFEEPLCVFASRHKWLVAHLHADKQWSDGEIIRYVTKDEDTPRRL